MIVRGGPLRRFVRGVCLAMGASPEAAATVAGHLVGANLRGHDSHGVLRLPQYAADAEAGLLRPAAEPRLIHASGTTAVVDAGRGFGHHSTRFALQHAIRLAAQGGVSAVAVRHSMHIGRLGEYTEAAARRGKAAIVTVGSAGSGVGLVAPYGTAVRFTGTNPWSMAVPTDGEPFVFDGATSAIAEGKARVALAKGAELPEGAVRKADGAATLDPADLYAGGSLTPVGGLLSGHKGAGLAMAAALFGGLAMIDDDQPTLAGTARMSGEWGDRLAGVLIVVLDIRRFGALRRYRRRAGAVLDQARSLPPDQPEGKVLTAGDPERRRLQERTADGILIPEATWAELTTLSERYGVPLPAH